MNLVALKHRGSWFPHPGLNPHLLHWKVDSFFFFNFWPGSLLLHEEVLHVMPCHQKTKKNKHCIFKELRVSDVAGAENSRAEAMLCGVWGGCLTRGPLLI